MLIKNIEKDVLSLTYGIFEDNEGELTKVGVSDEDGVEYTIERELSDIKDGEYGADYDTVEVSKKVLFKFNLLTFNPEDIVRALPGVELIIDEDKMKIDIKGGQVSLYKHSKKYVLKPIGVEDDNLNITLYNAVNVENFTITFKPGEPVKIPLNLKCFRNRETNKFGTIGDTTI